ncbi:hypothetical protein MtrunA17_Chr3g0101041 [Medicago truncatula]|uniref:Uncharacterized protein n=1 Tax=Medicago truncatula TaxID=3880 RepID=A0A396INI0_MEDTR|nr:hypothetical protein MtrunA17_Chr3g0101041 [Medicago truncatula]
MLRSFPQDEHQLPNYDFQHQKLPSYQSTESPHMKCQSIPKPLSGLRLQS